MIRDSHAFRSLLAWDPGSEGPRTPRANDRSTQEWAAALSATGFVPAHRAISFGEPEPATPWHPRDGALTPGAPGEAREAQENEPIAATNRVALRVDAADLGEVAIAIDRMDSGVRVTIEGRDDRAVRALEPERQRIVDVLTSTGVRVDSVTVVRAGMTPRPGIPLAQGTERVADESAGSRTARPGPRRSQKKNHFVG
jgi:hypothetical protein